MQQVAAKVIPFFQIRGDLVEAAQLLHDTERKVLSPCTRRDARNRVKRMTVIDAQQAEDRQEDAGAYTD